MSLFDAFKSGAFKKENQKLLSIIEEMGAGDAVSVRRKIEEYAGELNSLLADIEKRKTTTLALKSLALSEITLGRGNGI